MEKNASIFADICANITKFSIYALVFLIPIFFLPWTSDPLEFNKQALLVLLAFVALFAWIGRALATSTFKIKAVKMHIFIGLLFLAYVASMVFSVLRYGSFWGFPEPAYESILSLIGFCTAYFLVANTFGEKEISVSSILLSVSFLCAEVFAIFQLFGLHLFWFSFAKSEYFNTVGSLGMLGLFSVMMFALSFLFLINAKKWWKAPYIANIAVIFIFLLAINYYFIWWLALACCALIILFWVMRRDVFDGKWLFLPSFLLIVSLFFIVLQLQINILPQKPLEVGLSNAATMSIDVKALHQSLVLGSGPGTFVYDFLKYEDSGINNTSFWNVQFDLGASRFLTSLATVGILGVALLLWLIGWSLCYGIRQFITGKKNDNAILVLVALMVVLVQTIGGFLYNTNMSSEFVLFFFLACLATITFKEYKTYNLKASSLATLAIIFIFTATIIFGLGFLVLEAQRYYAEVSYQQGLSLVANGQADQGLKKIETAASVNGMDLYFRQLSQIYLFQAQSLAQTASPSGANASSAANLQALITNSLNAAKTATDINPNSLENWQIRASIYQNLIGFINNADSWAEKSYSAAIALNPTNPYFYLQRGVVYYQTKDYKDAEADLEKAVALKSNYSDAWYFLGLAYDADGQTANAINAFLQILKIGSLDSSQVAFIQAILNNVNAGKDALNGLTAQTSIAPPVTSVPSSTTTPSATVIPGKTKAPVEPTKK